MNEKLCETMARVMGLSKGQDKLGTQIWYEEKVGKFTVRQIHGYSLDWWNPTTDLNQAMMCLKRWVRTSPSNVYYVIEGGSSEDVWVGLYGLNDKLKAYNLKPDDKTALAICKAIKVAIDE